MPGRTYSSTKHYHLPSNKTQTPTCCSIQVRSRLSLSSSLQLAFNHFTLRSAPALQEETNKARQRAEESRQNEEDSNTLTHIQHGEKHNSANHHSNSADGDGVYNKKDKTVSNPSPTVTVR
jgi:chromatin remodeling complex protein RSC6